MAKKLLYLEHCERILNDKKNQIQLLEEQLEKEKERQVNLMMDSKIKIQMIKHIFY